MASQTPKSGTFWAIILSKWGVVYFAATSSSSEEIQHMGGGSHDLSGSGTAIGRLVRGTSLHPNLRAPQPGQAAPQPTWKPLPDSGSHTPTPPLFSPRGKLPCPKTCLGPQYDLTCHQRKCVRVVITDQPKTLNHQTLKDSFIITIIHYYDSYSSFSYYII